MERLRQDRRRAPFLEAGLRRDIDQLVDEKIRLRIDELLHGNIIAKENAHSLKHGRDWVAANANTSLDIQSFEFSMPLSDFIDHRIEAVPKHVETAARTVFESTFNQITEHLAGSPAEVSLKPGANLQEDMLSAFDAAPFLPDLWGRITPPQVHYPAAFASVIQGLLQDPRFAERLDAVLARKEREGMAKEVARLSRYRWPAQNE